jgi:hypothetical protein
LAAQSVVGAEGGNMKRLSLKKLMVVPIVLATVFLALSLLLPATAAGMIRTVSPALLASSSSVSSSSTSAMVTARSSSVNASVQQATRNGSAKLTSSTASSPANIVAENLAPQDSVTTAGHSNCGRFGNGFHGGKHNFVCTSHRF